MKKSRIVLLVLVIVAAGAYFGLRHKVESDLKPVIDKEIADLKAQGVDTAYERLNVNIFSQSVDLENVTLKMDDDTVAIDNVIVQNSKDFSQKGNFAFNGVHIPLKAYGDEAQKMFDGAEELMADLDVDYDMDQAKGAMELKRLHAGIEGFGYVEIAFKATDLPLEMMAENPLALLFGYPRIVLHSLSVTYAGEKLIRAMLDGGAAEQGKTSEALTAEIIANLDKEAAEFKKAGDKKALALTEQIRAFIADKKGLTVTAKPEKPLKLGDLARMNEEERITALNLKAESM